MKKIFYSALVMALTATAFTSCEDVPAPYSINFDANPTPTTPTVNAVNTEATAFTVAEALQKIAASNGGTTVAYVKGKISEVSSFNATYGSITYYISDNGTDKALQIYSGLGLNGAKFTGATDLNVGDEVVVLGDLKAFTNKAGTTINEMDKNNKLVSRVASTTPAAADLNTQATAWTVAETLQQLNAGKTGTAYVKGTITGAPSYSAKYKSYTYYLSDNGTTMDFQVYSGKNQNGSDFTGTELQEGMVVVVKGDIKNFVKGDQVIPEMDKNNELVQIVIGGSSTSPSTPSSSQGADLTVKIADLGLTDKAESPTFTASDGSKFTFSKANGANPPKYYTNTNPAFISVRMYANNTLKIEGTRKIAKIVMTTTEPGGGKVYNGDDSAYAESGSNQVTITKNSDTLVTFSGLNSETVTIVNQGVGAGTQLRIVSIAITYAN